MQGAEGLWHQCLQDIQYELMPGRIFLAVKGEARCGGLRFAWRVGVVLSFVASGLGPLWAWGSPLCWTVMLP